MYTEQIVLMLMNSIRSIRLKRIEGAILRRVEGELKKHVLDNLDDNQVENIKWKVFLELLNKDFLSKDFLLKKSTPEEEKNLLE